MNGSFNDEPPPCPCCDGTSEYQGTLGTLDWWRCRHCGMMHQTPINVGKEEQDEQRRRRAAVLRKIVLEGAKYAVERG